MTHLGQAGSGSREHGRKYVQSGRQSVTGGVGLHDAGPNDHCWLPVASLPRGCLGRGATAVFLAQPSAEKRSLTSAEKKILNMY